MSLYSEFVNDQVDGLLARHGMDILDAAHSGDSGPMKVLVRSHLDRSIRECDFSRQDALFVIQQVDDIQKAVDLSDNEELGRLAADVLREDIMDEVLNRFERAVTALNSPAEGHGESLVNEARSHLSGRDLSAVEPGSEEEGELVASWLQLFEKAGEPETRFGEFSREDGTGIGFGDPDLLRFEIMDVRLWDRLPHLRGADPAKVREYFADTHLGLKDATAEEVGDALLWMVHNHADPVNISAAATAYRMRLREPSASTSLAM